jgi:hypothetical protein
MLVRGGVGLLALGLAFVKGGLAQDAQEDSTIEESIIGEENLPYHIPQSEVEALEGIVEDVPPASTSTLRKRKDWLSPEYKFIYQKPLPIPPVKQPKLYVIKLLDLTFYILTNLVLSQTLLMGRISGTMRLRSSPSLNRFTLTLVQPNSLAMMESPQAQRLLFLEVRRV